MNKTNKFKSFFARFVNKKEKQKQELIKQENDFVDEDSEEIEDDYEVDYSDETPSGVSSLKVLVNEKQKMDYIKNKDTTANIGMLNDLSLDERELLDRELQFKYDFDDYVIKNIFRDKKFIEVSCDLVVTGKPNKLINIRIYPKENKKSGFDF